MSYHIAGSPFEEVVGGQKYPVAALKRIVGVPAVSRDQVIQQLARRASVDQGPPADAIAFVTQPEGVVNTGAVFSPPVSVEVLAEGARLTQYSGAPIQIGAEWDTTIPKRVAPKWGLNSDHLLVGTNTGIELITFPGSFEVVGRVLHRSGGHAAAIALGSWRDDDANAQVWNVRWSDAEPTLSFTVNNGVDSFTVTSSAVLADDQWYWFSARYDLEGGEISIFVDDTLDSLPYAGGALRVGNRTIYIGSNISSGGMTDTWRGLLMNLGVANRMLTDAERTLLATGATWSQFPTALKAAFRLPSGTPGDTFWMMDEVVLSELPRKAASRNEDYQLNWLSSQTFPGVEEIDLDAVAVEYLEGTRSKAPVAGLATFSGLYFRPVVSPFEDTPDILLTAACGELQDTGTAFSLHDPQFEYGVVDEPLDPVSSFADFNHKAFTRWVSTPLDPLEL